MGKGGSKQAPTDSTVRQTNLPEYADPYFRRMLQGAEEALMPFQDDLSSPIYDDEGNITGFGQMSTYMPYQGERIAPSSMYGDIQASRAMTRGIAQSGIAGMPEAMDAARYGMGYGQEALAGLSGLADYQTGDFSSYQPTSMMDEFSAFEGTRVDPTSMRGTFQAADTGSFADEFQAVSPNRYTGFREAEFTPFGEFDEYQFRGPSEFSQFDFRPDYQFQQFQFQQPERFTSGAAQQYMSPYMDAVVQEQKRGAIEDFERSQSGRDASAVQAGAFGGSRQAVGQYLAEEGLQKQLGGIEATGRQQAFEQAAQQFGLDRAARMESEARQASEFGRVQTGQAGEQARVDQARYTELASREQAQAAEYARAGDQEAAERARVQASKYQDLARIQQGRAAEMGRVQAAQASENARVDAMLQQEAARTQAGRVAELGRAQGLSASEIARIQAAEAGEQGRLDAFLAGEQGRLDTLGASELARIQGARAAEMGRLDTLGASELARIQQAVEQSRQFGSGQGLAAYQAMMSGAGQYAGLGAGLASLGERQRAADIQGAQLLEAIGRDIRAEDQARLDLSYEDFLRQRDYPISQYERMAGILRGVPVTPNVEQQRFASYNPIQQALGAGISALGLYRGLQ
jgi:hypothetical protein